MARPRFIAQALLLILAIAAATSCGDDGPTGLNPDQYELILVSGDGQTGLAGTVLSEPLVVQVRRLDPGAAQDIEGVTVTWTVDTLLAWSTRGPTVRTDESGLAATRVALRGSAGQVEVRARVPNLAPVTFTLTALPGPALVSITPSSADPGDTVEVRVSNLPAGMQADVLFDGVEGEVVSRVDGSPAVLNAVVPAPAGVCGGTTQTVAVRVRVGELTTGMQTMNVSVPVDPFQVGQVLVVEGSDDVQCALLPADGGTARYLLVALSAEFETEGSFEVTLGSSSVTFAATEAVPPARPRSFHDRLRAFERQLAAAGLAPAQPSGGPQLVAGPRLGSQRNFWVLNDVDVELIDATEEDFDRVTATLKYIGVNALLYIDDAAPANGLTQADIDLIGEVYDQQLLAVDLDFFGEPTDVDGNDQVIVLLSPTVNGLTERGADAFIVGFFLGLDLVKRQPEVLPVTRFSNEAELFYGFVPDPTGEFSDPRSKERVVELLPGVMVHESQHMISWRYKVVDRGQEGMPETLWLSEGMAHMAEELGGDAAYDAGDIDLANDLYSANFGRLLAYLEEPSAHSLTVTEGSGTLEERGAAWVFLRWIADQYGDFIFRDLTQKPDYGVANVAAQTGESFFRLFADWAVALWAEDQEIPGLADRYQIPKWLMREILLVSPPGGGDPIYVLQPLQETFATFRSDSISEFLAGSSPLYVELDADGDTQALQLRLNAATDVGLAILRYE
ncbi:MAG: hypothetical protein JSV41_07245 [Gemmatimonadota bacterium]|nr:MAG: hypothetical protein JSV41_07245 [Gemmatimonadota bacterium]